MQIRPDEWRFLYGLRDDLDGEDQIALRRLIKYVEYLESEIGKMSDRMHQIVSRGSNHDD
jgi:hypothetical protein